MAFLDLFKPREARANPLNNPAVSLSSPAIWSWLTGGEPTAAGEEINHFTAMQTVSVYACIRVIAESVASLHRADSGAAMDGSGFMVRNYDLASPHAGPSQCLVVLPYAVPRHG
jgi:hypothetical protein